MRLWMKAGMGLIVLTSLGATLAFAQGGGMGGGMGRGGGAGMMGRGGMGSGDMQKQVEEMMRQRNEMLLSRAGFTASEKAAALQALKVKQAAGHKLQDAHNALQEATSTDKLSDAAASAAAGKYLGALSAYRASVASADRALAAKLSRKARAKALAFGILDNGVSSMWMPRSGGMGRGGGMMGGRGGMMGGGMGRGGAGGRTGGR